MKLPISATSGGSLPNHHLYSNIPRAAAQDLCETFKEGQSPSPPPQTWLRSQMWSVLPSEILLFLLQARQQHHPQALPKGYPPLLGTSQQGRDDRRVRNRSVLLGSALPMESSTGKLSQLASAHSPTCCWCQVCGSKGHDCKETLAIGLGAS